MDILLFRIEVTLVRRVAMVDVATAILLRSRLGEECLVGRGLSGELLARQVQSTTPPHESTCEDVGIYPIAWQRSLLATSIHDAYITTRTISSPTLIFPL